jgi:hypothetical protein
MWTQGSGVRAEELEDVRALVRQLSADQARMRADLQSFSNHATQLMSALQVCVWLYVCNSFMPMLQISMCECPLQRM